MTANGVGVSTTIPRVWLGLGSNVGDRLHHLRFAIERVSALRETGLVCVSPVYETEPIGHLNQPAYLNLAAEIKTGLAPLELLNAIKAIEREAGRCEGGVRWGPRPLDIDVLLWGNAVIREAALEIPHPRFRERAFVLAPLRDIAPEAIDPVTGYSVATLAARPEAEGRVERVGPLDL